MQKPGAQKLVEWTIASREDRGLKMAATARAARWWRGASRPLRGALKVPYATGLSEIL